MKKIGAVFFVAAALLTLINASVWEGAASGSSGGDLPETGYYVATNSFPRNTVVDITNLENGKTVRAIVSAPLENPGLLAVLSRDAADAIGLPARSIGRVRMNQPADPVAFSRFTEGLSSSGDPDHDPAAFVAANGINPELLAGGAGAPPEAGTGVVVIPDTAEAVAETDPPDTGAVDIVETGDAVAEAYPPDTGAVDTVETGDAVAETYPPDTGAVDTVETSDAVAGTGAPDIIPLEDHIRVAESSETTGVPEEESAVVSDKTGAGSLEGMTIVDLPEPYVPPASPKPDEGITPETNPELVWVPREETGGEELIEPRPEDRAEVTELIRGDTGELAGQLTDAAENGDIIEPGEALAEDTPGPAEKAESFPGDYELTLIPSEERPPESAEPVIPADQIFPPAETRTALTPPPARGEDAPSLPPVPAASAGGYGFPVPVITELEEGKYYLQLAASRNQDAVKTELAKIGEYWPLTVQVSERESYPYRILVGPVHQGESRALLLRFKNSGYQNAFVTDKALQTRNK
jgi:hypothetical protein